MDDERLLRVLRTQAWERAKGELNAMRHTFFSESNSAHPNQYRMFDDCLTKFIDDVEDNGLQE